MATKPAPAKKAAAKKTPRKKLTKAQQAKGITLAMGEFFEKVPKLQTATKPTTSPATVTTDWEAIERDFRAGVLSIREIAKLNDVSEGAVRKKAKTKGWERDLTARVNEKVRTDLVRSEVRTADPQTEKEIVEVAAATVVSVVRGHRARIKQGNELVELLTKQLTDVAGKREEFEDTIEEMCAGDRSPERRTRLMKAVALGSHSSMAVNLANATKVWIGLERQAFNIADSSDLGGASPEALTMEQIAANPKSRLSIK